MSLPDTNGTTPESPLESDSDNLRFISRPHVRDAQGNYVMATDAQILAEAVLAIDYCYPTGTIFESSDASREFSGQSLQGENVRCLPSRS